MATDSKESLLDTNEPTFVGGGGMLGTKHSGERRPLKKRVNRPEQKNREDQYPLTK